MAAQVRDQWFVKMQPLAEPALAAVSSGDIRIVPERFEKVYNRWLENIRVRISPLPPEGLNEPARVQRCCEAPIDAV